MDWTRLDVLYDLGGPVIVVEFAAAAVVGLAVAAALMPAAVGVPLARQTLPPFPEAVAAVEVAATEGGGLKDVGLAPAKVETCEL